MVTAAGKEPRMLSDIHGSEFYKGNCTCWRAGGNRSVRINMYQYVMNNGSGTNPDTSSKSSLKKGARCFRPGELVLQGLKWIVWIKHPTRCQCPQNDQHSQEMNWRYGIPSGNQTWHLQTIAYYSNICTNIYNRLCRWFSQWGCQTPVVPNLMS